MAVRGVVQGPGNRDDLRFGRPGQHKSGRWCEIRSGQRKREQASTFPALLRPPRKDQARFGDMFLKGKIVNFLTEPPLSDVRNPQNKLETSVMELWQTRYAVFLRI